MSSSTIYVRGIIGQDARERKVGAENNTVLSFSIAVRTGKDKTVWLDVDCWSEFLQEKKEFLKKGQSVLVSGSLASVYPYMSKSGEAKAKVSISAKEIYLSLPYTEKREERQVQYTLPEDLPF